MQTTLREAVKAAAQDFFGVALDQIAAEVPPRTQLGDLAFPVAFELAKRIKQATGEKRAPRAIAEQLAKALEATEGVARVEVAGAGYLNVFFDRTRFLSSFSPGGDVSEASSLPDTRPKRMVEHTSLNPNKAAHIGHVRNAVLGDTFVRILRAAGERVEVQNYIDNTGVQVADVVVGFIHLERLTLEDIKALDKSLPPDRPFDYYCWDLYTRVGLFYRNDDASGEPDAERLKLRADTLHQIEEGDNPTAELADYVATRNVECILDTMERLGIRYDVLPRESEILRLKFWDHAFERMKQTGVIHLEAEGRNKGCWVMPFESHTGTDEHEADKIIVRSNGTVTYTGKDIAYQLWKLGQLGLDFYYKPFRSYADNHLTWMTTSEPQAVETCEPGENVLPHFGEGSTVYNVIDSRQSYTQDIVRRGVAAVAPEVGEEASVHLGYEMVALSITACDELGIKLRDEDRARPFVEMSGRKGYGVKADDLITRLEGDALHEVETRHPDLSTEEKRETAHTIAVGALRYFLLKFTRNSVIAFDFKEALSFEGETGPYCQYSAVRANSIFRKLDATALAESIEKIRQAGSNEASVRDEMTRVFDGESGDEIWSLVTLAARFDEAIAQAVAAAEPSVVARYTFNLARAFNLFYHRHRIIAEEDATKRAVLVAVADIARRQLTLSLATLGIGVPERM
ncbi:MAG: arginine--tRNA ligase [Acidobacteria bacterium]|nr:arginine--tRNA ligase [Acidobacteriota bacterium]